MRVPSRIIDSNAGPVSRAGRVGALAYVAALASAGAKIEKLALTAHARHPFQQEIDVAWVVDEVQTLAVDDQKRRVFVAIEEARIGVGQPGEIIGGNCALEVDAAPMHALDQRRHRLLKVAGET